MAAVEIHPEPVTGPWLEGLVLDRHVISSRPTGYAGEHMQFDTTRSALGELIYQLKYKGGSPDVIVETASVFILERWAGRIDCIVSPPPSLPRARQPAAAIASGVANQIGVQYKAAAVVKATATQ